MVVSLTVRDATWPSPCVAAECTEENAVASAIVGGETKHYDNLKEAFDNADDSTTVILLKNVTITTDNEVVIEGKSLTFDSQSYTVTTTAENFGQNEIGESGFL